MEIENLSGKDNVVAKRAREAMAALWLEICDGAYKAGVDTRTRDEKP